MNNFDHLLKKHPCFGEGANFKYGRIHLPVSPICNIQCRFCKRGYNKFENIPGVSNCLVKPDDAVKYVRKALTLCPEITVVGIAGPGDTLASEHALKTFEYIHKEFPDLINCMSTNGLMLPYYSERIIKAGINTVTVTVNSIRPEIESQVISHIIYDGEKITGNKAAEILIENQLKGIKLLSSNNVTVKINTVLIPGLNDRFVEEVAKSTSDAGASLINIIPLIPQNEMAEYKAPLCSELNNSRQSAEKYLRVFRHCQHCRADACGIPGKGSDLADKLYGFERVPETFSHG